jgi:glycosyltransferase involved in cell wall biosynthesis
MDFLTFPPDYWNGPRHNRHYFCEELSKENRVLFASPPLYIGDMLNRTLRNKLHKSGIRRVNENLLTYTPSRALFKNYRFPRVNNWMKEKRIERIKSLMRNWNFDRPVLLMWHPRHLDMVGRFDEKLVIYYVYDQYSGYIGGNPSRPDKAEIELLKRSDIVFTLTEGLYEDKKKWAGNIYHLPNAVDYDLFSKSRETSTSVPDDIREIPQPVIGYIGTINEKVDVPLLDYISDKRKDWSIVLVGRENYTIQESKREFESLVAKSNVHWLGPKPYHSIPAYIKGLDICMMCYVINDWTFFGDPSKMHEYLASGKPTVATGLPAIKKFDYVINIPDSKEGWVEAIEESLKENNPDVINERIEVARQNSYPYRAKFALSIIENKLSEKR